MQHRLLVVMGPSGCGKSTVGGALAAALGFAFIEGDDLHSAEARARMAQGVALTDADRMPWLDAIGQRARALLDGRDGVVVACSALKRAYRRRIAAAAGEPAGFVLLMASRDELARRMQARQHFMPVALLDSQLATLEFRAEDECALQLDATAPLEALVAQAAAFARGPASP